MLKQFLGPNKAVAVVSDAYDLFNAIENIWGDILREDIISSGGVLVVRPDSGDPATMVCKSLELLGQRFGYTYNTKGYKLLPSCIRLIQGDGVRYETLGGIVDAVLAAGWSIDNISFGMGHGLSQDVERDDIGWCMKASAICRNGIWYDVYKDPITSKSKASKRGRLAVIKEEGVFKTIRLEDLNGRENLLRTIFYNGVLVEEDDFYAIQDRANG